MPAWKVEERKRAVADTSRYDGLVKAAKAGVPIVFGTDAGSPVVPHDVIAPELAFMVKLGICTGQRARAARDHLAVGADERPAGRPRPARARARRRRDRRRRQPARGHRGGRGDRRRVPRRRAGRLARGGDTDLRARRPARAPARAHGRARARRAAARRARATGGRAAVRCATSADFHLWGHDGMILVPLDGEPAAVVTSPAVAGMIARHGWIGDSARRRVRRARGRRFVRSRGLERAAIGTYGWPTIVPEGIAAGLRDALPDARLEPADDVFEHDAHGRRARSRSSRTASCGTSRSAAWSASSRCARPAYRSASWRPRPRRSRSRPARATCCC